MLQETFEWLGNGLLPPCQAHVPPNSDVCLIMNAWIHEFRDNNDTHTHTERERESNPNVGPTPDATRHFLWHHEFRDNNDTHTHTHRERERVIPMLAQPLMRHVISYGILLAKTRSGVCPSTLLENPRKRMGTERLRRRDVRDLERLLKARPRGGDHEGILRATCDSSVSTVSTSKKWGFHEDFMEFVWDWMGFDVLAAEQSLWEIMIFDQ